MIYDDTKRGFDTYKIYLALKQHFSSNYDFFKYKGKVRATEESFLKRRDKYFFQKIQKKYDSDLVNFFVANFASDDKAWVGNMVSDAGEEIYKKWKRYHEALCYNFKEELLGLIDYCRINELSLDDLLKVHDSEHPELFKLLLRGSITIDFIVLLNNELNFFVYWESELSDIIWGDRRTFILKYAPFLQYDHGEIRKIIKETINNI